MFTFLCVFLVGSVIQRSSFWDLTELERNMMKKIKLEKTIPAGLLVKKAKVLLHKEHISWDPLSGLRTFVPVKDIKSPKHTIAQTKIPIQITDFKMLIQAVRNLHSSFKWDLNRKND